MRTRKLILTAALAVAFCGGATAQSVLTPHLTEESMKIVVPKDAAIFPEIHEGLIAVSVYPRMMFVKPTGEWVFGTDFGFTRGHDTRTPYFSGGAMMGSYKFGDEFSNSNFIVYPDGKYRRLPSGVVAASGFVEGYALIHKGNLMFGEQYFIDKNGREVFPALKSKVTGYARDLTVYPLREGRRLYYNAELEKYGYANEQGAIAVQPKFDKALGFSDGLAAVMVTENNISKWGFIDASGKMVIPATYRIQPGRFSEGLAPVRIGESESDCVMNYIDKSGARLLPESLPLNLNEFHDGFAWVGNGCEKLYVVDKEFNEVRDVTADFYHNGNGFGVCMFSMDENGPWGIDFPGGLQMLNQGGVEEGDIFAPNGELIYTCRDYKGGTVLLHSPTEGGLMYCEGLFIDDERHSCFIDGNGEVVYYFVEGYEGYEGPAPVEIK